MTIERPSSIKQFLALMKHFRSPESQAAADAMQSNSTDVFISTFAKSGTTWMQQIVHQLKSGADDSFADIYEVVPWIESALDMGINLDTPQAGLFRAFKSHMSYDCLPKSKRYITVFRNPAEVACSWFRFFEGWLFETNSIALDEFARHFYMSRFSDHQAHYEQWYGRINEAGTLVLCYEDIISKPDDVPLIVADFLDIHVDATTMGRVIKNSSREYMYNNKVKFEERLLRKHIDMKLELPETGESSKVNKTPTRMGLSSAVLDELESIWRSSITRQLGFENYEQLRSELPNPLGAKRGYEIMQRKVNNQ